MMYNIRSYFILILTGFFFFACNSYKQDLQRALDAAGVNRPELEKVLDHYSRRAADSLKLKAAEYLIRYMPYHRSYNDQIEELYNCVDSLLPLYRDVDSLMVVLANLYVQYEPRIVKQRDIEIMSADYLIDNIDQAFSLWYEKPWAQHLDFDEFCTYLLPYKCIDLQPLSNWRDTLAGSYMGKLGKHSNEEWKANPRIAATEVNSALHKIKRSYSSKPNPFPIFRATTLTNLPRGTCEETSIAVAQIMLSKGIPVSIDFTPQWAERPLSHFWMTVLNHRHQNEVFSAYQSNPGEPHFINRPLAKVFRISYKPNSKVLDILNREKKMPNSLQNIFAQDVTETYTRTDNIVVPVYGNVTPSETVYLSVFDNVNWIPVYWGNYSRHLAYFENMGRDVLYLPIDFKNHNSYDPIGDPILLKPDGEILSISPDTIHCRTVRVTRKYPIYEYVYTQAIKLYGGKIEAADNSKFKNAQNIVFFPQDSIVIAGTNTIECSKPYRYWRFCSSHDGRCDMAELMFFNGEERLSGKLITCGREVNPKAKVQIAPAIHDDNALTFFCAQGKDYWVGFDFGKPVNVTKIIWFRRGDGNDIYPSYDYTLYFWDGRDWKAIEKQQATNHTWLDFQNVPNDALLLLKCDTKGTQCRPFLYDNGNITWL